MLHIQSAHNLSDKDGASSSLAKRRQRLLRLTLTVGSLILLGGNFSDGVAQAQAQGLTQGLDQTTPRAAFELVKDQTNVANENSEIDISAENISFDAARNRITATGHVELVQGERRLVSERMEIDTLDRRVLAEGDVRYTDKDGNFITASRVAIDANRNTTQTENVNIVTKDKWHIAGTDFELNDNIINLKNVKLHNCLSCSSTNAPPSWELHADEVRVDLDENKIDFTRVNYVVAGDKVFDQSSTTLYYGEAHRRTMLRFPRIKRSDDFMVLRPSFQINLREHGLMFVTPVLSNSGGKVLEATWEANYGKTSIASTIGYGRSGINEIGYTLYGRNTVNHSFSENESLNWDVFAFEDIRLYDEFAIDINQSQPRFNTSRYTLDVNEFASRGSYTKLLENGHLHAYASKWHTVSDYQTVILPQLDYRQTFAVADLLSADANDGDDFGNVSIAYNYLRQKHGERISQCPFGQSFEACPTTTFTDTLNRHYFDAHWQKSWRTGALLVTTGLGVETTLKENGDASIRDLLDLDQKETQSAVSAYSHLNFSMPFIGIADNSSFLIEPFVDLFASKNNNVASNRLSYSIRSPFFHAGMLGQLRRDPGLDTLATGTRVDYGVSYSHHFDTANLSAKIGQSVYLSRPDDDSQPLLAQRYAGLTDKYSDIVFESDLKFDGDDLDSTRYLLAGAFDPNRSKLRNIEVGSFVNRGSWYAGASYALDKEILEAQQSDDRSEVRFLVGRNWNNRHSFGAHVGLDATRKITKPVSFGGRYQFINESVNLFAAADMKLKLAEDTYRPAITIGLDFTYNDDNGVAETNRQYWYELSSNHLF